ncbi:MAG: glutamine-hydrolyzing carbamoyl-phosphate synthase small subunit [Proteobacteria bacterium]|nr:glutamine-hydrolyzing carbamoyl-phosphate synthase small subunit [Pseudomonadota bacterium]MDE3208536.1 glutamine-hydrolyzing carbamoyl-phosphate synthase small subunit [Pseudomonadota bacterium]
MPHNLPALLALADGSLFRGISIGAEGSTVGEVVFNTAMTGYQEILTDPSYNQQIVTLTHPHIGNTGVNPLDAESDQPYAAGLIVRDLPRIHSNWRSQEHLSDYLKRNHLIGISGIDTRRLTTLLRTKGAQNGCIMTGPASEQEALAKARAFPGLAGMDLAKVVTCRKPYEFCEGEWQLSTNQFAPVDSPSFHVVAYDYGIKRNILRMTAHRGCKITVLPATATAEEALRLKPDGILLSNGPGDPDPCDYAIRAISRLMGTGIPIFGICLGFQLIALASGAKTIKMKFGHHGANHPVQDLDTRRVLITSQNHGFSVDPETLPDTLRITHVSLFDGSLQGLARTDCPVFCFQGHPEASPGPQDISYLFDRFVLLMKNRSQ